MAIILRSEKGSSLTFAELDENFSILDYRTSGAGTLTKGTFVSDECDISTGNIFVVALTANKTITFSNVPTEGEWSVLVTATGTRTLSFTGNITTLGDDVTLEPPVDGKSRLFHFFTSTGTAQIFAGQSI